jgi:hypothetical protein
MVRGDEPRLVDNPFRRESHRPWYARRGPRWIVGIAVVLLLGLNALAFKKVSNRADPVTVETAIARYRATAQSAADTLPSTTVAGADADAGDGAANTTTHQQTSPGAAQQVAPTESAGTAGEAGVERGPTPAPGVYVYDTSGFERVSALGGAQHDFPKQSTITITDNGCGDDIKWAPLEQRWDNWSTCSVGAQQIRLNSYSTHHEFFGQTEERTYPCQNVDVRPISDEVGTTTNGTCARSAEFVNATTTVVGPTTVIVKGVAVDAIQIHLALQISGDTNGSQISDLWLRPADGLMLRYESIQDADGKSVIGPTHFHEEDHLTITDLSPLQ